MCIRDRESLRSYLADKFAREEVEITRDEYGFILSYRGFSLRIWVVVIPKNLEKQVEAIVGSKDIDYCELDYSNLFRDRSWFKQLVEALNSIIRS